jgi:hypothetical protein
MPVFINEVITENYSQPQTDQLETVAVPAADEQAEAVLRLLQIQQERQIRLMVD